VHFLNRSLVVAAAAIALLLVPAAASASPTPFGRDCEPNAGVRFCPSTSLADRVPTFDGTPLDVDVTLPPTGDGPFPTLLLLHGLSSNKGEMTTNQEDGGNHFTNVWFANQGYMVLTPNQRGHGNSCGKVESRTAGCERGWLHLADQRYEVRDMQYLLGLLVDQGLADPEMLGSAGCSYGSAITLQLAMLRDRTRMLDGTLVPWVSPEGTPLEIKAGYASCAVADWVALLGPNGRLLDYEFPEARQSGTPTGVAKASVGSGALALLGSAGYVAPPLVDPSADFQTWVATALTAPPDSPLLQDVIDELLNYHSAIGIDISDTEPAPMLIENGWADDYTPPEIGGLRMYRYLRSLDSKADVTLQLADWGHARSKQKPADAIAVYNQATEFLNFHVRGVGSPPRRGSVTAWTQTCPASESSAGPFKASSWHSLHPGEVSFEDATPRTITQASSDPGIDTQIDPVAATPCASYTGADAAGVAVYRHTAERAFTLLGLPTVDLDIEQDGNYGQLIARLWDEAPDGSRVLVTRGVYRTVPGQTGHVTFQLFGGGWRFEPGHTARLDLAGTEAPFFNVSAAPFSTAISNVRVSLPTHERPDGGEITANSHEPQERCRSHLKIKLHRHASRVVVRSGGSKQVLRDVRPGRLRLKVTGRRARISVHRRDGTTRKLKRTLCQWV
jgi:pimeloyl-ACP methyl ester carboxylesterase